MCIARGKVYRSAPYPPDMKDQDGADEIAADALKRGMQPAILLEGCMRGMDIVGKDFSENKAAVTNLVISAAAMNAVLKHIKPFLESGEVKRKGKFVIGTVSGDLHDIGKNLVSMIVTGGGFEVIDLGVDVPTSKFLVGTCRAPGVYRRAFRLADDHHAQYGKERSCDQRGVSWHQSDGRRGSYHAWILHSDRR